MESPNESDIVGMKRKSTESGDLRACKASRLGSENKPSFPSCVHVCRCRITRPSLADSCFNYLNSGMPCRIMYYNHGDWLDFPESVTHTLVNAFKNDKSSIRFSIGDQLFIFDFLSMAVVNLRTRKQRSVAWIDDAEKCYFPSHFGEEDDDSTEWDLGITGNRVWKSETGKAFVSPPEVVKQIVTENGTCGSERQPTTAEVLRTKIENVERGSENFLFVQKLFLSGMGPFATPDNILYIHRYVPKDINGQIRLENFKRQTKATEEERGVANVQYGWFGSKKSDIVGILIHGFGTAGKPTEEGVLGTGVYLTPENRAFASVNLCDVDEKGIQFMILCRTILGNAEQVLPGSKQYFPSSDDYDSGVDDLLNPKCYIVWSTHLKAYVHPEYLVSFKLPSNIREYLFGLKDIRFHITATKDMTDYSTLHPVRCDQEEGPVSPWMPFTVLFDEIRDSISPLAMELLFGHYLELKSRTITREEMVKRMRLIVGDQLLISTLKRLKRSPSLWYEGSAAKKMKLDAPTKPISRPDDSAARPTMGPSAPAIPTWKPDDSATKLTLRHNDSAARKIENNRTCAPSPETNVITVE